VLVGTSRGEANTGFFGVSSNKIWISLSIWNGTTGTQEEETGRVSITLWHAGFQGLAGPALDTHVRRQDSEPFSLDLANAVTAQRISIFSLGNRS
jgi:hypothetical protein